MAVRAIAPTLPLLPGDLAAGLYLGAYNAVTFTDSTVSTSAFITYLPFYIPTRRSFDRISVYLVTLQAGAACRVGIYTNDAATSVPAALIVDGGELSLATGSGSLKEATVSITLDPGWYWSACHMKNVATQATMRRIGGSTSGFMPYNASAVTGNAPPRYLVNTDTAYGALASTAPAVLIGTGSDAPGVWLRAA